MSSTSNVSDFGTLLAAFSPEQSAVALNKSAVSAATGLGSKASAGIDFEKDRDHFDLSIRTVNDDSSDEQLVEVSESWIISTDESFLAEVETCAGFRIEVCFFSISEKCFKKPS